MNRNKVHIRMLDIIIPENNKSEEDKRTSIAKKIILVLLLAVLLKALKVDKDTIKYLLNLIGQ